MKSNPKRTFWQQFLRQRGGNSVREHVPGQREELQWRISFLNWSHWMLSPKIALQKIYRGPLQLVLLDDSPVQQQTHRAFKVRQRRNSQQMRKRRSSSWEKGIWTESKEAQSLKRTLNELYNAKWETLEAAPGWIIKGDQEDTKRTHIKGYRPFVWGFLYFSGFLTSLLLSWRQRRRNCSDEVQLSCTSVHVHTHITLHTNVPNTFTVHPITVHTNTVQVVIYLTHKVQLNAVHSVTIHFHFLQKFTHLHPLIQLRTTVHCVTPCTSEDNPHTCKKGCALPQWHHLSG